MSGAAEREPCVVFTGGGSGGHVYPGLAVIEELRPRFAGRIVWIGSNKESDRKAVEAAGVEYFAIPSGKLRRQLSLENAVDVFRVIGGYLAARKLLKELKPAFLFSKGGYVSVPPCRAAADLGIPYVTHESDLSAGLATRLNAKRAEALLLAYAESVPRLPESLRDKARIVGNPIRAAISRGDRAAGRAALGLDASTPLLFVLGGSQGARQVNELVAAILPALRGRAFVLHQTGPGKEAAPAPGYLPLPYIGPEMADYLAAADLVIGRSGAGTLWEAGSLGKPLVLIPLAGSGTRGDQVENAELFERAGAAKVLVGPSAGPEALLAAIEALLADPSAARAAGEAARGLTGSGAAKAAADLILERIGASR